VKNQARPDCENYHPSFHVSFHDTSGAKSQMEGRQPDIYIGEPELYLKETFSGFDLKLVIRGACEPEWSGSVLINGRFGEQVVGFELLRRPYDVSVLPQTDRYVFSKRGEVGKLFWETVRSGIIGLKFGPNCFHQSSIRGRRLASSEKMFWGDTYWIVSPTTMTIPGSVSHFLTLLEAIGKWSVFELTLPSKPDYVLGFEKDDISTWVGHRIYERKARAYFIDPLPHHLDQQGIFVLSTPISTVQVALDPWEDDVLVLDSKGNHLIWNRAADNSLIISLNDSKDAFTYVDGALVLAMRFEACELFTPTGLRLKNNDQEVELFSKEAEEMIRALRYLHKPMYTILIEASNEHILKLLKLNGAPIDSSEALNIALRDRNYPIEVDASNFGKVFLPVRKQDKAVHLVAPKVRDRGKWLLSLPFPPPGAASCRFPGENGPNTPDWVQMLRTRNWSAAFGPYLETLAHELKEIGCL
jgi:hypothetical protein